VKDQTKELREVVEDWAAAEQRGDAASLEGALAEDFIGIGPRGFMLTKDQWLERHESGKLRYRSLGLDEVQVRLYGDAAVVTGRQSAEGKYEDFDLRDQFRATLVFVKQRERWMLAGLHLSPIAGPAS
jgi:ketosteroid isomerase-like protein